MSAGSAGGAVSAPRPVVSAPPSGGGGGAVAPQTPVNNNLGNNGGNSNPVPPGAPEGAPGSTPPGSNSWDESRRNYFEGGQRINGKESPNTPEGSKPGEGQKDPGSSQPGEENKPPEKNPQDRVFKDNFNERPEEKGPENRDNNGSNSPEGKKDGGSGNRPESPGSDNNSGKPNDKNSPPSSNKPEGDSSGTQNGGSGAKTAPNNDLPEQNANPRSATPRQFGTLSKQPVPHSPSAQLLQVAQKARVIEQKQVEAQTEKIQQTKTQEASSQLDAAKKEIDQAGFNAVTGGLNSVYCRAAETKNQQAQNYARMAEKDIREGRPQNAAVNSYLSKELAQDAQYKQFEAELASKQKRDSGNLEKASAEQASSEGLASAADAMKQAKDMTIRGESDLDKPMSQLQGSMQKARQVTARVNNVAKLMEGLERQGFEPKSLDSIKTVMQAAQALLKPQMVLDAQHKLGGPRQIEPV